MFTCPAASRYEGRCNARLAALSKVDSEQYAENEAAQRTSIGEMMEKETKPNDPETRELG
jgi:hypothetical protein